MASYKVLREELGFDVDVVRHLGHLCQLLEYANGRNEKGTRWAWDNRYYVKNGASQKRGVYGHTMAAIEAILIEELGAERTARAVELLNWGGDCSRLNDLLNAVVQTYEEDDRADREAEAEKLRPELVKRARQVLYAHTEPIEYRKLVDLLERNVDGCDDRDTVYTLIDDLLEADNLQVSLLDGLYCVSKDWA